MYSAGCPRYRTDLYDALRDYDIAEEKVIQALVVPKTSINKTAVYYCTPDREPVLTND
jgi:hypothetical protein